MDRPSVRAGICSRTWTGLRRRLESLRTTTSSSTAQVSGSCLRCTSKESKTDSQTKGQIELYTHHPFLPTLVANLNRMGIRTSAVYLLESQFIEDKYKFFRCACPSMRQKNRDAEVCCNSGVLSAMSAMVNLEIPWINVMSKMDLVAGKSDDPGHGRNGIRRKKDVAR